MCKDKKIMKSILFFIVLMLSLMFFATNVYAAGFGNNNEPDTEATYEEASDAWDALRQYYANQGYTQAEIDAICNQYSLNFQYEGGNRVIPEDVAAYVDASTEFEVDGIIPPTSEVTPPLYINLFVEVATEAECEERADEEVQKVIETNPDGSYNVVCTVKTQDNILEIEDTINAYASTIHFKKIGGPDPGTPYVDGGMDNLEDSINMFVDGAPIGVNAKYILATVNDCREWKMGASDMPKVKPATYYVLEAVDTFGCHPDCTYGKGEHSDHGKYYSHDSGCESNATFGHTVSGCSDAFVVSNGGHHKMNCQYGSKKGDSYCNCNPWKDNPCPQNSSCKNWAHTSACDEIRGKTYYKWVAVTTGSDLRLKVPDDGTKVYGQIGVYTGNLQIVLDDLNGACFYSGNIQDYYSSSYNATTKKYEKMSLPSGGTHRGASAQSYIDQLCESNGETFYNKIISGAVNQYEENGETGRIDAKNITTFNKSYWENIINNGTINNVNDVKSAVATFKISVINNVNGEPDKDPVIMPSMWYNQGMCYEFTRKVTIKNTFYELKEAGYFSVNAIRDKDAFEWNDGCRTYESTRESWMAMSSYWTQKTGSDGVSYELDGMTHQIDSTEFFSRKNNKYAFLFDWSALESIPASSPAWTSSGVNIKTAVWHDSFRPVTVYCEPRIVEFDLYLNADGLPAYQDIQIHTDNLSVDAFIKNETTKENAKAGNSLLVLDDSFVNQSKYKEPKYYPITNMPNDKFNQIYALRDTTLSALATSSGNPKVDFIKEVKVGNKTRYTISVPNDFSIKYTSARTDAYGKNIVTMDVYQDVYYERQFRMQENKALLWYYTGFEDSSLKDEYTKIFFESNITNENKTCSAPFRALYQYYSDRDNEDISTSEGTYESNLFTGVAFYDLETGKKDENQEKELDVILSVLRDGASINSQYDYQAFQNARNNLSVYAKFDNKLRGEINEKAFNDIVTAQKSYMIKALNGNLRSAYFLVPDRSLDSEQKIYFDNGEDFVDYGKTPMKVAARMGGTGEAYSYNIKGVYVLAQKNIQHSIIAQFSLYPKERKEYDGRYSYHTVCIGQYECDCEDIFVLCDDCDEAGGPPKSATGEELTCNVPEGKKECFDGDPSTPCHGSPWIVLDYDKKIYLEVIKNEYELECESYGACLEYDYNSDLIDVGQTNH